MIMRLHIWLLTAISLLTACTPTRDASYTFNEGEVFGTTYHLTYRHPEGKDLHEGVLERLGEFDRSLSTYNSDSLISRINRNEPDVVMDHYMMKCLGTALEISKATGGAFDITVGPLVQAWGFGNSEPAEIRSEHIEAILHYTGYRNIRLDNHRVIKAFPETQLDVNAIAKGMAVDVVAEYLQAEGCTDYMVEIGGEVRVLGVNPSGTAWRLGIDKPVDAPLATNRELQTVVPLKDSAMATSGNYRNFYIRDGVKYAHTIDPRTGYPVQHKLLSATVIAPDCMTADAYATALMVM